MGLNVLVTRLIPQAGIDLLKQHCDTVDVNPEDRPLTREELLAGVKGRDGVLCLLTDAIDDAVFEAAGPQCKIFANYAVGYNNIDVDAARKRGVRVSNTPGVLTDATADMAWALLFSASRRIAESDAFMRTGRWQGWGPMQYLGQDITGRTLGVVGVGRIGAAFARKSAGFNMKVLYCDQAANAELERDLGARKVDFDTLLKESDFISVHVPLLPETTHLVSAREFGLMKPNAVLINTSRGPVVDEKALVAALKGETHRRGRTGRVRGRTDNGAGTGPSCPTWLSAPTSPAPPSKRAPAWPSWPRRICSPFCTAKSRRTPSSDHALRGVSQHEGRSHHRSRRHRKTAHSRISQDRARPRLGVRTRHGQARRRDGGL